MSTIKDVAKRAGVSVSTVSRALSGRIFVEEETRQRVLKAVEELNYQPSLMARGLKEGKSYSIGFLVPDINSLFYPMIMKAIERRAAEKGYTLVLMNNDENPDKEKQALTALAARGVDGVLCMSVEDETGHLLQFQQERHIPVVMVNRDGGDRMSGVLVDNEYGGYRMTQYLLEHGHRKISGVFGGFEKRRFRARYEGCRRALEEAGVTGCEKYFLYDVASIEEAYRRTRALLEGEDRPTAFFASMDILAIGIYRAVHDAGLRIPEDVSVAGFDNIFMSEYMIPALTTYNTPVDEMAEKSVELLLRAIDDPACGCVREVIAGTLTERESVKQL